MSIRNKKENRIISIQRGEIDYFLARIKDKPIKGRMVPQFCETSNEQIDLGEGVLEDIEDISFKKPEDHPKILQAMNDHPEENCENVGSARKVIKGLVDEAMDHVSERFIRKILDEPDIYDKPDE